MISLSGPSPLVGRHLSLPAGGRDWETKLEWFGRTEFLAAQRVGFIPAFEWKGPPPTSEVALELIRRNIHWGIHAPNNFVDQMSADWKKGEEWVTQIAQLRPGYVVVHGGLDRLIPLHEIPLKNRVDRYRSPITASSLMDAFGNTQQTIRRMVELMMEHGDGVVLLENTSVTEFVDGTTLPTYCHPRIGNWVEVGKIARDVGAKPLCDIGHLTYCHNYLAREHGYAQIPDPGAFDFRDDDDAQNAWDYLDWGIHQGRFPIVRNMMDVHRAIEAIGADYYHVEAGIREENEDGTIGTHAPVEYGDERMRQIIGQILGHENLLMCLEVDGSRTDGGGSFPARRPTEELQRESFIDLCRICTDLV